MKLKISLFLLTILFVIFGGLFKFNQGVQKYKEAELVADSLKELSRNLTINYKDDIISEDQLVKVLSSGDKYAVINDSKKELFPDEDLFIKVDVNDRFNVSLAKDMRIVWEEKRK